MIKDGNYNVDIFWPEEVAKTIEEKMKAHVPVLCAGHCEMRQTEYNISPKSYKAAMKGRVVECTMSAGRVVKVVTRVPHRFEMKNDLCFAITFCYDYDKESDIAVVVTCWVNNAADFHPSKDVEEYVRE